jgi:hypothetical protein
MKSLDAVGIGRASIMNVAATPVVVVVWRARRPLVLALAAACLAAACAGQGRVSGAQRNASLIAAEEIQEQQDAGVRDLFELVSRQRPAWLQTRTERSLQLETTVLVYHNETRLGGVDALRGYPLLSVTSLRYLDAAQAGLLPGAGSAHVEGAIVIRTGSRRRTPSDTGTPPPSPASISSSR